MPGVLRADAATPGWEEPGAVARRDLAERRRGTGIAAVERGRIHGGAGPVGALGAALQDRSIIAQLHGVLAADVWELLRQRAPCGCGTVVGTMFPCWGTHTIALVELFLCLPALRTSFARNIPG